MGIYSVISNVNKEQLKDDISGLDDNYDDRDEFDVDFNMNKYGQQQEQQPQMLMISKRL